MKIIIIILYLQHIQCLQFLLFYIFTFLRCGCWHLLVGGGIIACCCRPHLFPCQFAGGQAARLRHCSFQIQTPGLCCAGSTSQHHGSCCRRSEFQSGNDCCCRRHHHRCSFLRRCPGPFQHTAGQCQSAYRQWPCSHAPPCGPGQMATGYPPVV